MMFPVLKTVTLFSDNNFDTVCIYKYCMTVFLKEYYVKARSLFMA